MPKKYLTPYTFNSWGFIAVFFAALAPALSWPQFSGDSEDLLVQTTLEMRHGGPWWVPTLGGVPRTRKPPLPAWITASAVSDATVRDLSHPDPAIRDAAYQRLAFQVRWPALLAGALMLLVIARLAEVIGGPAHVLPAVLIAGTTLLLIRFIRSATTDVYLALWVTVANACLVEAVLRGRRWAGCLGAGVAVGLAILSKGPVAIVQTVLPILVFAGMARNARFSIPSSRQVKWLWPSLAGIAVMLTVALPWFVITAIRDPNSLAIWTAELNRADHVTLARDPWYGYISFVPNLLPWIPLYLGGFYISLQGLFRRRPIGLAFLLVFVPILVLSFFHDRKERYLLPLIGPAAVLAAHAAVRLKRAWPPRKIDAQVAWWAHWAILAGFAIGLPMLGALRLQSADGGHWYSPRFAWAAGGMGLATVVAGLMLQRRHRLSFVITGAALTLAFNLLFLRGWSASAEGRSEMKPVADRIRDTVAGGRVVYYDPPPGGKPVTLDLDIYLNRSVQVLAEPPSSAAYGGVSAVVVLRRDRDPEPRFVGWKTAFDLLSRTHHWYVLVPSPG